MTQATQSRNYQRNANQSRGQQDQHAGPPQNANPNAPVETIRVSNVSISLFENVASNDDNTNGAPRKYYRASVDKRYRDSSGHWKSGTSFSLDELLRLRFAIDQAVNFMIDRPANS